jgi:hypothetical protein
MGFIHPPATLAGRLLDGTRQARADVAPMTGVLAEDPGELDGLDPEGPREVCRHALAFVLDEPSEVGSPRLVHIHRAY